MKSLPREFKKILKSIDLFSIPVPLLTNDAQSQYSSYYSGFISILASVLSIAYFVYVIQEWANGNILPTITTNQSAQAYTEQGLEENFIQFKLSDPTNHDPFRRKNNIITPLIFSVENYKIASPPTPLFSDESNPFTVGLQQGTLVVNNLNTQNNDQSYKPSKNYLLIFIECLDEYLDDNSNCASQEEIDNYMSKYHGFLSIIMKLEQYNFRKNQKEYIMKQAYQAFSPTYIQYTQIRIQQKEINLDNGLLFENLVTHKYINDFNLINQSIDNKYIQSIAQSFSQQNFQLNAIFAYQISIDNLQISERIIQPKLSAVLAYVGSIVQVIFMLKYLAVFINNQQFKVEVETEILQMYYPKLKDVKVKRNVLGKIISTNQGNEDNKNAQFIIQYQDHLNLAFKKLRLINIIYELSRIELLMEKHFGLQNICECSQLGSEFQFLGHDNKNESPKVSILSVGNQSPQPKDDIFRLFNKG
ncbi:unnamed protein product (macronuclear) [Paramecium tetraurelia]|uniref:Transmembrane protein n=1 Tax=Paramecium tetraurelia TaxID=5888 RepID=A0D3Z5_PARTE|nr:uncharacterized protein GSPATT00013227001 [Paramecium tetraurelia]CAK77762.1 unnamed protein product [Paramecium tetraurelia]|eukprot:XP_001445159.1 hypothetical protein (macronuclear) [Paramecium tetraurelia strain d4-2]